MNEDQGRLQFTATEGLTRTATKESINPLSLLKRKVSVRNVDVESVVSEKEAGGVREIDYKRKQTFKGWTLLWLAYQATGVIYGDIGTSPLYVYSSTFSSEPSREDLLGALSLIIWSLTIMVTFKYVCIVLRADDEGEGGTFAIYTLLSRFCNIMKRDPRVNTLVKMERHKTNDLGPSNRSVRTWLERSKLAHGMLKILAVLGVSLVMADGILTPAQSVLGAIQGLEVVKPGIGNGTIVGVSCAILVCLYVVQPLGIHRLSSTFAPIVIVWLLFNGITGVYNLATFDWRVLKAFSPYFAGDWFVRNGTNGWLNLGGILLAFTGVEALFADLGAFSRRAVQISWLCLAYPCLLLAYIGQAAHISMNEGAYANPFFNTLPPGCLYWGLVVAILAAVVASQALITSTFQLLSQVMHSSYFPHIKLIHKSETFHGQVYIPMANWIMMVGTVIVTAVYSNTTKLGHAYGVCVILVTFITTNLVTLVAIIVWRVHPALVFTVWLPFIAFDGMYLSSALTKVPDGAWFTLLLAVILASFFSLWRYGKEKQWACEAKDRPLLSNVITKNPETNALCLTGAYGGGELAPIEGFAIFFDKAGAFVPAVYEQWLCKFRARMGITVLMHIRPCHVPHISEEDHFAVSRTSVNNVYRVTIRHGYNDHVVTPDLARLVYDEVRKAICQGAVTPGTSSDSQPNVGDVASTENRGKVDAALSAQVRHLDEAFTTQALYIVGKEQLRVTKSNNALKRLMLGLFLWVRDNCRSRVEKLNVPIDKLVEIGFVGEI